MHVLLVCSANRCRSPIAAALLTEHLRAADDGEIRVDSAGLLPGGEPVPAPGLARMSRRGLDLRSRCSVQVSDDAVETADLVLGMGRDHVRALVAAVDDLWWKSFTLKDFVRRATGDPRSMHEGSAEWIRRLAGQRDRRQLIRASRRDDIVDPMGRSEHVWDSVVAELDDWTGRLARVLTRVPE